MAFQKDVIVAAQTFLRAGKSRKEFRRRRQTALTPAQRMALWGYDHWIDGAGVLNKKELYKQLEEDHSFSEEHGPMAESQLDELRISALVRLGFWHPFFNSSHREEFERYNLSGVSKRNSARTTKLDPKTLEEAFGSS